MAMDGRVVWCRSCYSDPHVVQIYPEAILRVFLDYARRICCVSAKATVDSLYIITDGRVRAFYRLFLIGGVWHTIGARGEYVPLY